MRRLAIAILLTLGASPASSATLRVERDGSADYTTIQPAIGAAAPGDTILIGPGHYTEHQTATLHLWSWSVEVYALVRTDSLTIMGTDRDAVVIGPDTSTFLEFGPKGIVFDYVSGGDVRSLTLINTYTGLYLGMHGTGATIAGSMFEGCGIGVSAFCEGALSVVQCAFESCSETGVSCFDPTTRLDLANSLFNANHIAVDVMATPSATIQNCRVTGGNVGIQFEQGSVGSIVNCHLANQLYTGVFVTTNAVVDLNWVAVSGGTSNLRMDGGRVSGANCVFEGGTRAAVFLPGWPRLILHNCHILSEGGKLVELVKSNDPPVIHADLRNNYWGIADRDSIAALIWDGTDDPTINGIVDFEPFSAVPLPTEKKSLGSVKGLYR